MRKLSTLGGILVLAMTAMGCADSIDLSSDRVGSYRDSPNGPSGPNSQAPQELTLKGTVAASDKGNSALGMAGPDVLAKAAKVVVSRLEVNGNLIPVGTGTVQPNGNYEVKLTSKEANATYIIAIQDLFGAVVGSAVLNGIPAFLKGLFLDIPIDVVTSFKTEILMTLASGGVPGVQNYLNVINTFLDEELAGWLIIGGAFSADFVNIVGAVSKAIIATENVIAATLGVDISKLTDGQLAVLSGVQGFVTTANGTVATTTKNLLMALEQAVAKGAAPIDKLLFNAVVGGGAMFGSVLKGLLPVQTGGGFGTENTDNLLFSVFKSTFKLESLASLDTIDTMFKNVGVNPQVIDALKMAGDDFIAKIDQAKDMKGLADAKAAFNDMLIGKQATPKGNILQMIANAVVSVVQAAFGNANAKLDPVAKELATALGGGALTDPGITGALANFDTSTKDLSAQLKQALSEKDAEAMADAMKTAAKVFLP